MLPLPVSRLAASFAAAAATLTFVPSPASAFQLGIQDPQLEVGDTAQDLPLAAQRLKAAGGTYWRILVQWDAVSPTRPASVAQAADPTWSGYNWTRTDAQVRAIASANLQPLPFVQKAPTWAEGANRPSTTVAPAGSWRPNAAALRSFASALAKRYSGTFADPANPGKTLPRVGTWQVWNEPNLSEYLTPQWSGSKPASPALFRTLQNGFYDGMKSVDRTMKVVTGGTAPFGDLKPGDPRMPPVTFWRSLLCVKGSATAPKASKCPTVKFDAYAHHPYPIGPPNRKARNANDVTVPDLRKLTRVIDVARKRGSIKPAGTKTIWATEISWDSTPDPDGLSQGEQAIYLQGALNVLWKSKADVVIWFNLRDQAPIPSFAATYQSGLFARGESLATDVAKPSLTAFSFPFTAYRSSGVAQLWGLAPAAGSVQIQIRTSAGWVTQATATAKANRVFQGKLRVSRGAELRAVSGTATSLTWTTS